MAARNSIEKGVVALGGGSFVEVKPPVITAPEVLYLAYRGSVSSEFRKSVQTRPANLVAYWPMDEGDGIVARDALGRFDGSLVPVRRGRQADLVELSASMVRMGMFRLRRPENFSGLTEKIPERLAFGQSQQ